jgi:hypothetical protein
MLILNFLVSFWNGHGKNFRAIVALIVFCYICSPKCKDYELEKTSCPCGMVAVLETTATLFAA